MWLGDQCAHVRERLTENRSNLTLQGRPNQHGTYLPRRTIRANHSPPRLELQDRPTIIWSAELNVSPPKVNICNLISPRLLDYPRRWVGVLYFRGEAVLGLPVSTTSYSRYAVSTIQTWSAGPTTVRSSIDSDGAKTPRNPILLPYLYLIIIPPSGLKFPIIQYCMPIPISHHHSPVRSQISNHSILYAITHILEYKDNYKSRE